MQGSYTKFRYLALRSSLLDLLTQKTAQQGVVGYEGLEVGGATPQGGGGQAAVPRLGQVAVQGTATGLLCAAQRLLPLCHLGQGNQYIT